MKRRDIIGESSVLLIHISMYLLAFITSCDCSHFTDGIAEERLFLIFISKLIYIIDLSPPDFNR